MLCYNLKSTNEGTILSSYRGITQRGGKNSIQMPDGQLSPATAFLLLCCLHPAAVADLTSEISTPASKSQKY